MNVMFDSIEKYQAMANTNKKLQITTAPIFLMLTYSWTFSPVQETCQHITVKYKYCPKSKQIQFLVNILTYLSFQKENFIHL